MNDNLPESERWVPVAGTLSDCQSVNEPRQSHPTLSAARREAEAVIAKAFKKGKVQ